MTNIAVVTTIDRRSAIARATMRMAVELAESVDVTIFAEPTTRPLRCPLALRSIDHRSLRTFDHVVAVLGDSPFHVQTFKTVRKIPSVVILHDVLMAHLVASLPHDELRREFVRWYGPAVANEAMRGAGTEHASWNGPNAIAAPLFESVIELATGVIVHSQFAARHVAARSVVPVKVIPLGYEAPWAGITPSDTVADNGHVLLTLGHANPNKSHELIIEALAELDDPTVRFVIAGLVSDERRKLLEDLAVELGVGDQLEVTGAVSDERAFELLRSATVCLNLRRPAIEGASASLIEQMAAGKCVVVFDHGCYADAPDDAVIKLPVDASPATLAHTIGQLLTAPDRRREIGQRAAGHAGSVHGFVSYAADLLTFLGEVESALPYTRLAREVASVVGPWGISQGSSLATRWAEAITSMTSVMGIDSSAT